MSPSLAKSGDDRWRVRLIPHPYRALLAISTDLDSTTCFQDYIELLRFFNTTCATSFGRGIGLNLANSIYATAEPRFFSYRSANARERAIVHTLIKTGHIDTLHSFGDLTTTRAEAAEFLHELERHGCRLRVWVDHSVAPTNLGLHLTKGLGDDATSAAYHADLSLAHGIRYCWRGQITSVIGQDNGRSGFSGLRWQWTLRDHRVVAAKELVKCTLSSLGSSRYSMHAPNRTLRRQRLRDNGSVFEFLRCNPHPRGMPFGDDSSELHVTLSSEHVDKLMESNGAMILYVHLGQRFPASGTQRYVQLRNALEHLERLVSTRQLLVLTTASVLDYLAVRDFARVSVRVNREVTEVDISAEPGDHLVSDALERSGAGGISVAVPAGGSISLQVAGKEISPMITEVSSGPGERIVSVPIRSLDFPAL